MPHRLIKNSVANFCYGKRSFKVFFWLFVFPWIYKYLVSEASIIF